MPVHGRCFYCALPVRFADDCAHPGHGVVDYVAGVTDLDLLGLPNLRLLHAFCRNQLRSRTNRSELRQGLAIRRARLGRATEAFEAGLPVALRDQLGLSGVPLRDKGRYPKYWRVTKMRYAMRACRYY